MDQSCFYQIVAAGQGDQGGEDDRDDDVAHQLNPATLTRAIRSGVATVIAVSAP